MLRARVLTVVLGVPPFLAALWWGGHVWAALVALLAGTAAVEAVGLGAAVRPDVAPGAGVRGGAARTGEGARCLAGHALAALLSAGLVLFLANMASLPGGTPPMPGGGSATSPGVGGNPPVPAVLAITLVVLAAMILDVASYPGGSRAPSLLLAILYPGLGLGHLVLLRQGPEGLGWSLLLLATVWTADIAAYFSGTVWSRHRLAPHLSPRKSWEGAVGGVLAAALVGLLTAPALVGLSVLTGGLLGAGMAVAGMSGDLAESALKRAAGRKDSGRVLPGHGGVLDRFDSLAFAAPVLYWCRVLGGM